MPRAFQEYNISTPPTWTPDDSPVAWGSRHNYDWGWDSSVVPMMTWPQQAAPSEHDLQLQEVLNSSEPSEAERKIIHACIQKLKGILANLGNVWHIRAFGSAANGFATKGSDLDVTCVHDGVSTQNSELAIQELRTRLAPLIREEPSLEVIEEVWSARVPILKLRFQHLPVESQLGGAAEHLVSQGLFAPEPVCEEAGGVRQALGKEGATVQCLAAAPLYVRPHFDGDLLPTGA
ncbi:unnamed protein product [Effrenium voratum]|nr:unnamed protein product [Effrenium voratum]